MNNPMPYVLVPFVLLFRAVSHALAFVVFKPVDLLLAHTPAGALLRRYSHEDDTLDHLARETMSMRQTRDDLLVHDRRREYAERLLPAAEHPTWYANVPKHLRRSVVAHGRIRETGFAPAAALAGNVLTPGFVERAWSTAVRDGVHAAAAVFVAVIVASSLLVATVTRVTPLEEPAAADLPMAASIGAAQVAQSYRDVFTADDVNAVNAKLATTNVTPVDHGARWAATTTQVVAWPLRVLLVVLAALLASFGAGRLRFIGRFRWYAHDAIERRVADLRKPFREALQRWKFFLADRSTNDRGYADQVHFATQIDRSPLLYFGDGEGQMEAGGHLLAPRQGHEFCQSIVDALQHHEVLGGSGESKSRDFYVPLLAQILEYRKQGFPLAVYVTDEKGAIVEDVRKIAGKLGLEKDLLIIGTGPNDYRVDLMKAGSPALVAEFVKSAARQAGSGGSGQDFWAEMGNDLLLNIWIVTEAAEKTRAGVLQFEAAGMRLHSIKSALRLATSDSDLREVLDILIDARGSPEERLRIRKYCTDGLENAIRYLIQVWLPMVAATRDGIRANLRNALRTLTMNPTVAEGFADGVSDWLIPASDLHSNRVKVLNVSQIEHGAAGRLVNIVLKSMFFKQCRDVQQQDPAFADRRLAWWFDPKLDDPEKDRYYLEFFLADEYQSLITSDPSSGMSDATIWNVLRSAGVAGVTISQGIGAYEYAIGRDATANVRRQWRSKHFLRTEDTATIEEAKKLVGKTMRFQVSAWGHYESTVAVRRELGTDPDNLAPATWDPAYDQIGALGSSMHGELDWGTWEDAFDIDRRFLMTGSTAPEHAVPALSALQSAHWRQEDRSTSAMQHGLLDADVLRDEQIMAMTRGRSLCLLQVAGGTQADIIRLNARSYRNFSDDRSVPANAWQ